MVVLLASVLNRSVTIVRGIQLQQGRRIASISSNISSGSTRSMSMSMSTASTSISKSTSTSTSMPLYKSKKVLFLRHGQVSVCTSVMQCNAIRSLSFVLRFQFSFFNLKAASEKLKMFFKKKKKPIPIQTTSNFKHTTLLDTLRAISQATHNPRAEEAKQNGCSHEQFLQFMQEDDEFDADLTPKGIEQARQCQVRNRHKLASVDLVVSSPLSRAIKTADPQNGIDIEVEVEVELLEDEENDNEKNSSTLTHTSRQRRRRHPRRICIEELREINGWLLNAKRRTK